MGVELLLSLMKGEEVLLALLGDGAGGSVPVQLANKPMSRSMCSPLLLLTVLGSVLLMILLSSLINNPVTMYSERSFGVGNEEWRIASSFIFVWEGMIKEFAGLYKVSSGAGGG